MFKIGDDVKCIDGSGIMNLMYGKVYKVTDVSIFSSNVKVNKEADSDDWCLPSRFELFSQFDLKKNPWFIRINSEVEFDCVQNWLEDNFGRRVGCDYHGSIKMVTNTDCMGNIYSDDPMWSSRIERDFTCHEIILEFETVVKSVTYPVVEVETEQDKKIKELKETIDKAQQQLEELMSK